MAGNISLKRAVIFFISLVTVMILSACMSPIDLKTFMENTKVQDLLDTTRAKVIIHEDSDDYDNLVAESGKISGLTPGRYYRVEEYDENRVFKQNLFVKANGYTYGDLSEIAFLELNQILGLNNNYTYKVKYARQFSNNANPHKFFNFDKNKVGDASVSDGNITVAGNDTCYLDLALDILLLPDNGYELMKIPVSGGNNNAEWGDSRTSAILKGNTIPSSLALESYYDLYKSAKEIGIFQYHSQVTNTIASVPLKDRSIIKLETVDTKSDYVLAEYKAKKVTEFTVLTVTREVDEVEVNFSTVTFAGFSPPVTPTFTGAANYSAGSNGVPGSINITITVVNDTAYTTTFKWWVDGTQQAASGKTLTITGNVDNATNWYQKGTHTITIQVTDVNTNIPYTGEVTITCN